MDSVFRYFPDLTPRQREQFAALGTMFFYYIRSQ